MRHLLAAVAFAALAVPGAASGAEYTVDRTTDGAGNCAVAGQCSLRAALGAGNTTPERDLVHVPPGTYDLTGADLIVTIGDQVDVVGTDPRTTILREVSGGDGRVFLLEQDSALALSNVTLTGSRGVSAVLLFGTGIDFRAGNVVFTGNTSANGAAVDGTGGAVTLENSTLTGNHATGKGGAVYLGGNAARFTALNSTIAGNSAPAGSGVYVDGGEARLTHVTMPDSLFTDTGATPGASFLRASIVGACAGAAPGSLGANLEPGAGCGLAAAGDRPSTDPKLLPLADNGGLTPTMLPASGSPAIDGAGGCPPPATDQRGVVRAQGPACDVGAVEVPVPPAPRIFSLRLTPSTFRAAARGPSLPTSRRPAPGGATIRFRLSRAALVRLKVQRRRAGRRSGRRCVAPTRRNRRAKPCPRLRVLKGSFELTPKTNSAAIRFSGRWQGRKLPAGSYRLLVTAFADGQASPVAGASFRVVR